MKYPDNEQKNSRSDILEEDMLDRLPQINLNDKRPTLESFVQQFKTKKNMLNTGISIFTKSNQKILEEDFEQIGDSINLNISDWKGPPSPLSLKKKNIGISFEETAQIIEKQNLLMS